MARRDVEEYYDVVCQDYTDMIEALHDMEEEATQGLISPEQLEQMRETIKPLKENYMRISYIMFLLNKPTKFDKFLNKIGIETKSKQYSQRVDATANLDSVHEENQNIVKQIGK